MCVLVRPVDIVDGDDGQVAVVAEIAQGDAGAGLEAHAVYRGLRHIERDGDTEEVAVGEAVLFDNAGKTISLEANPIARRSTHPS